MLGLTLETPNASSMGATFGETGGSLAMSQAVYAGSGGFGADDGGGSYRSKKLYSFDQVRLWPSLVVVVVVVVVVVGPIGGMSRTGVNHLTPTLPYQFALALACSPPCHRRQLLALVQSDAQALREGLRMYGAVEIDAAWRLLEPGYEREVLDLIIHSAIAEDWDFGCVPRCWVVSWPVTSLCCVGWFAPFPDLTLFEPIARLCLPFCVFV